MATFKLPVKKKHRKDKDNIFSPFPISFSKEAFVDKTKKNWSFYKANLKDGHLLVESSGDVHDLSMKGFFGKLISHRESFAENMEVSESSILSNEHQTVIISECDKVLVKDKSLLSESLSSVLYLNFYEGFFLSYGLGCLFITEKENNLDILQQWSYFCSKVSSFPILYAAYHHFRSKGWVPKDGIRYGADFLLYRKGPPYYHASYIVVVKCVCDKSLKTFSYNNTNERSFSWENLSGLLRLATTVSKEVMFCYVGVPAELQSTSILPNDLNRLTITENIISRWVSSKERDKELLDIDCDF